MKSFCEKFVWQACGELLATFWRLNILATLFSNLSTKVVSAFSRVAKPVGNRSATFWQKLWQPFTNLSTTFWRPLGKACGNPSAAFWQRFGFLLAISQPPSGNRLAATFIQSFWQTLAQVCGKFVAGKHGYLRCLPLNSLPPSLAGPRQWRVRPYAAATRILQRA